MNKIKYIIVFIIIIGAWVAWYYFWGREKPLDYETVSAKLGNISQEINVTGKIIPLDKVELAFEKGGRIVKINADVGDTVSRGWILAELDNSELLAEMSQKKSQVKAEEARLEELKRGSRPEELKILEVKVENAKALLEDAEKNMIDKIQDSYTKSDDAIRNKIDQLYSNPRTKSPILTVYDPGAYQTRQELETGRVVIEGILVEWNSELAGLVSSQDLSPALLNAKTRIGEIKKFLEKIALLVNGLTPSSSLSQTTINTYRSDTATARANVNTALGNLTSADEKMRSAKSAVVLAENELFLKQVGAAVETISAKEAELEYAQASVASVLAQLQKLVLRSPINGIVSGTFAKIGEIIAANKVIFSLISDNEAEVEANIPEVDIAKIKKGDTALITLDAYGVDTEFEAELGMIDPAETIIEGVATYRATFQFLVPRTSSDPQSNSGVEGVKKDGRIKPGMTANISVKGPSRENVLVLPQRAVISKNGNRFVRVLNGKEIFETEIKTGLRGSDGNVEITEGLKDGDIVILFQK